MGRYYVTCITAGSSTVDGSDRIHTMIKGRSSDLSPARRARTRACCFMVHDTGKGWRGGRRKETVTWYQPPRDTKTGLGHLHAALPPPAGSDNNSQLSITLTFLWINQSKLTEGASLFVANGLHVPPIAYIAAFSKRRAWSNITSGWDTNARSTRIGIGRCVYSNTRIGSYPVRTRIVRSLILAF